MNNVSREVISSKIYKGFQTVIPSKIRNELDINIEDTLNWNIEGDLIIVEIVKQKPLRDLEKFAIYTDKELDSVELKKKSGRGEF
jgi:bifunctional DNA-binding transcriptional regulator/antitoxin component of YhaV-PrlF toxin-antitoxin module